MEKIRHDKSSGLFRREIQECLDPVVAALFVTHYFSIPLVIYTF